MWLFLIVLGLFLWLLGSLEILGAPLPAILLGYPGHKYDSASASIFAPTSVISRRKSFDQELFPALPPLFSLPSLRHRPSPTFSTFVRFFLFYFALCILAFCTWVLLRSFRRSNSTDDVYIHFFIQPPYFAPELGRLLAWTRGFPAFVVHSPQGFLRTQHSRSALDII